MAPPRGTLSSSKPVTRRLGMYFVGVAIGLVLVGFLLNARKILVDEPEQTQTPPVLPSP